MSCGNHHRHLLTYLTNTCLANNIQSKLCAALHSSVLSAKPTLLLRPGLYRRKHHLAEDMSQTKPQTHFIGVSDIRLLRALCVAVKARIIELPLISDRFRYTLQCNEPLCTTKALSFYQISDSSQLKLYWSLGHVLDFYILKD